MSNGTGLERLWKLQTKVNMLVMDGKRSAERVCKALQEIVDNPDIDPRFVHRLTLRFTVPADYNHTTALASLDRSKFYYFNPAATDENFSRVSHQLIPGHTYEVDVFDIKSGEVVSSADCLKLAQSESGLLCGAQGGAMVWQKCRQELPKGRWYASFDEKNRLPFAVGYRRVPRVCVFSGGDFRFGLDLFEFDWYGGYGVLRFRGITKPDA